MHQHLNNHISAPVSNAWAKIGDVTSAGVENTPIRFQLNRAWSKIERWTDFDRPLARPRTRGREICHKIRETGIGVTCLRSDTHVDSKSEVIFKIPIKGAELLSVSYYSKTKGPKTFKFGVGAN